jgi:hypothetical protein
MPSITQIINNVVAVQRKTPGAAFLISGKPGEGKSDCCYDIAAAQGIPPHRTKRVHLGNYDRVELGGVPEIATHEPTGERITVFRPTDIFADFADGTGKSMIILEEAATSDKDMQQFVAQFTLERETCNFKLDPECRILLTGNRAEDRAGAKPLLSHLNDRLYHQDMETSLDDWCAWAMDNDVDPLGVAFLRLRPDLLNDFDPNRRSNPTQRSWTKLFTEVPTDMPTAGYLSVAEGKVGEGAAAEWVAARDMMHKMPSIDSIRLHPDRAEVPTEPAVRFAVATALSMTTEPEAFVRDMQYVSRMPKEFQMVYVTDALRLHPELQQTKDFINWAVANKDIFMGGN